MARKCQEDEVMSKSTITGTSRLRPRPTPRMLEDYNVAFLQVERFLGKREYLGIAVPQKVL